MSSGNEDIGEKYYDNTLNPARPCRPRPKSAHFQAQLSNASKVCLFQGTLE